jgi:hypothetical protein
MKNKKKNLLYYIYCALGEKSGKNDKEADKIALIRLLMFLSIFITNGFIIANTIRHWDDNTRNLNNRHLLEKQLSRGLQSVSIV